MELELHQLEMKYERLRIVDLGRQARLVASLTEHGQQNPVLVTSAGTPIGPIGNVAAIWGNVFRNQL